MANIRFYDAQISWRNIFAVSSLSVRDKDGFLCQEVFLIIITFYHHEERCSSTSVHFRKDEKVPANRDFRTKISSLK